MTAARRPMVAVVALVAGALLGAGCAGGSPMAGTRRALERAGYHDAEVAVRSGGGFDVARVDAAAGAGAGGADGVAEVVWSTLPVRFDQLVVTLDGAPSSYGNEALTRRFGPRDRALDRRQVTEEVVEDGLQLMLLLTVGAALSVGGVVIVAALVVRTARRMRGGAGAGDQAEGPISGLGFASSTEAGSVAADDPDPMPS